MSKSPLKIAFVIPALGAGGAERVAVLTAAELARRGHEITFFTYDGEQPDFYPLSEGIKRVRLNILSTAESFAQGAVNNIRRIAVLRRALKKSAPDAIISFMPPTNVTAILAAAGTGVPVVATEHVNPDTIRLAAVWAILRRLTYPFCEKLVCVSGGVADAFRWLGAERKAAIYNPLPAAQAMQGEAQLPPEVAAAPFIAAMGRLTYQKGFDMLLRAFAKLSPAYPDWRVVIMGSGELDAELKRLAAELGVADKTVFAGSVTNPFPVIKKAKFFVMPSRFEGFGNVLAEAMYCGCPVIAADCPSGPSEIVNGGADGLLVPPENPEALAAAMRRYMDDGSLRAEMAARAVTAARRFEAPVLGEQWDKLLHELACYGREDD